MFNFNYLILFVNNVTFGSSFNMCSHSFNKYLLSIYYFLSIIGIGILEVN